MRSNVSQAAAVRLSCNMAERVPVCPPHDPMFGECLERGWDGNETELSRLLNWFRVEEFRCGADLADAGEVRLFPGTENLGAYALKFLQEWSDNETRKRRGAIDIVPASRPVLSLVPHTHKFSSWLQVSVGTRGPDNR